MKTKEYITRVNKSETKYQGKLIARQRRNAPIPLQTESHLVGEQLDAANSKLKNNFQQEHYKILGPELLQKTLFDPRNVLVSLT